MQPTQPKIAISEIRLLTAPSTLLERLEALPRAAWILFAGTFLNRFGTFVIPFLTLYMTDNGYTVADAGMAVGAYGLGTLGACGIGGHLADRIGRRKTISLSMFCGAATMLLLSQAHSRWWLICLTALNGLAAEVYRPASSALLADLVPAGQRLTAFAAYRMALNAGWAFGPATAGFLATHSFSWLFIGDAVSSVLFGLVAWFALPHGVRGTKEQSGWMPALRTLRGNGAFLRVLAATLFVSAIFYQLSSTFSLHVTGLGFSRSTYGALISFNGLLVVLLELPITTVSCRFAPRNCMAAGYLLVGVGAGLLGFVGAVPGLMVAMVIFTLGEMLTVPVLSAYVADLAPVEMRGRYMGVLGLTWAVSLIFSPGIGMQLFVLGPKLLWGACAMAGLAAALIILSGSRKR